MAPRSPFIRTAQPLQRRVSQPAISSEEGLAEIQSPPPPSRWDGLPTLITAGPRRCPLTTHGHYGCSRSTPHPPTPREQMLAHRSASEQFPPFHPRLSRAQGVVVVVGGGHLRGSDLPQLQEGRGELVPHEAAGVGVAVLVVPA